MTRWPGNRRPPAPGSAKGAVRRSRESQALEIVNGYLCRNCADVELAKHGVDPSHPKGEFSGSEVYVPPDRNPERGVNRPETQGEIGRRLNLFA
ncbi:MAG TPA: hypothetical protein VHE30_02350 [Polyangiaceae bacterium]|nr:hypothetical protein [Polyangiaceae bacterium]